MDDIVDIKENYILRLNKSLLKILLFDRSSQKNIIWATDNYAIRGDGYDFTDTIDVDRISGRNGKIIKPRVEKSKREKATRIRDKAEVFTPSWVCNAQNNLIDEAWFGRKNVFNKETEKGWQTNIELISFSDEKTWQKYVAAIRMEITCGEAPYLVSRYDTVSGKIIKPNDRIGLLDRKIRIVNENTENEEQWYKWVIIAYQSVYGFDWQGDNVFLARENLLFSFIDYYIKRFYKEPSIKQIKEIARIISWNIWQMDGLKFVIPNSCKPTKSKQISIFEEKECKECLGCKNGDNQNHIGIYCKIKDWRSHKIVKYSSFIKRGK